MTERTIATGVATWLEDNRPGTVPASHGITYDMATAPKERPVSIVRCQAGASPHPKLRKFTLSLRTEYSPDDEATAGDAAEAHGELVALISASFAELRAALASPVLLLRVLVPQDSEDETLEDRTRVLTQNWLITIQTAL